MKKSKKLAKRLKDKQAGFEAQLKLPGTRSGEFTKPGSGKGRCS